MWSFSTNAPSNVELYQKFIEGKSTNEKKKRREVSSQTGWMEGQTVILLSRFALKTGVTFFCFTHIFFQLKQNIFASSYISLSPLSMTPESALVILPMLLTVGVIKQRPIIIMVATEPLLNNNNCYNLKNYGHLNTVIQLFRENIGWWNFKWR